MPKPNLKKANHTGDYDHLPAASIRRAITLIRLDLDETERKIRDARVRAHWIDPEEKDTITTEQIAKRQHAAMLDLQTRIGRWNRLTARFCEAWQVWQLKLQQESANTPATQHA